MNVSGDSARIECKTCHQLKALNEFYKTPKGHYRSCKECRKAYYRKRWKTIPKAKEINRKVFNKMVAINKTFFAEYMKNKSCIDCGENDPRVLDFDHVRSVKKHNISKMVSGSFLWSTILKEIEKCEIRCANCHRRKTYNEMRRK